MDSELKQHLEAMEGRMSTRMGAMESHMTDMEGRMSTRMGAMESHMTDMEGRMSTRMGAMESHMGTMEAHMNDMEARLMAHTAHEFERLETKLLTEFWKWGRTADMRTKQALDNVSAFGERLLAVEDRITALERNRPNAPSC